MSKRKFAAFDIDGTISRTSLFFQIVDELIAKGHLPADSRLKLDEKYLSYQKRSHGGAFQEYANLSVDILFNNLKSFTVEEYRNVVDSVVDKTAEFLYVYTRELIKELKKNNYFLIAISGSEMYAVQQFAKKLDFDLAVGETYIESNGHFTGEITEVFKQKDVFVKKYVEEHDLNYKDSLAIGDSKADIKMLELTEQPIAFNPELDLYKHAKKEGWKIIVERKNVVYELDRLNGHYILA